jgi:hypothetical protein
MAKKIEITEEVVAVAPIVEAPVAEPILVVEAPVKQSRSNGVDVPKPQPEQIGHATRAFRG